MWRSLQTGIAQTSIPTWHFYVSLTKLCVKPWYVEDLQHVWGQPQEQGGPHGAPCLYPGPRQAKLLCWSEEKQLDHPIHALLSVIFLFLSYLDSGYLVRVARLLVYMWPPTSMWTGALDFVSCAGVGMPWLFSGDAGDLVIRGLDILGRLSYRERSKLDTFPFSVERKETHTS